MRHDHRHRQLAIGLAVTAAALLAGCGDGDDVTASTSPPDISTPSADAPSTSAGVPSTSAGTPVVAVGSPAPSEMCPVGEHPIVAAYARTDGAFRWAACSSVADLHMAEAASSDRVYVSDPTGRVAEFDAKTGAEIGSVELPSLDGRTDLVDRRVEAPPDPIDGVRLESSQDGPTRGIDAGSGEERWSVPVGLVYSDVWPVGDGIVVLPAFGDPAVVAIEGRDVATGDVRWTTELSGPDWPWHVHDGRAYALWFNLHVLDSDSGDILWETAYDVPETGFPRMLGVVANDESVFISFTTVAAGGD